MNFDFGRDFGARAGEHFSNGEYAAGAINLMAGTGEAFLNTGALVGAAFLGGVGVNAAAYMASIEGRLMAAMTSSLIMDKPAIQTSYGYGIGILNSLTTSLPSLNNMNELKGFAIGFIYSEYKNKIQYDYKELRNRLKRWM